MPHLLGLLPVLLGLALASSSHIHVIGIDEDQIVALFAPEGVPPTFTPIELTPPPLDNPPASEQDFQVSPKSDQEADVSSSEQSAAEELISGVLVTPGSSSVLSSGSVEPSVSEPSTVDEASISATLNLLSSLLAKPDVSSLLSSIPVDPTVGSTSDSPPVDGTNMTMFDLITKVLAIPGFSPGVSSGSGEANVPFNMTMFDLISSVLEMPGFSPEASSGSEDVNMTSTFDPPVIDRTDDSSTAEAIPNVPAIPGFSPGVSSGSEESNVTLTFDPTETSSGPSEGCVCVEWWQCADNDTGIAEPNTENIVSVDLRMAATCPDMQICCDFPDFSVEGPPPPPAYTPQCGRLNPNGVLFNVDGFSDNQAQFGQFPWMVALITLEPRPKDPMYGYIAGGSLIHPQIVMTVAHKVADRLDEKMVVRLGEWDYSTSSEPIAYQEIAVSRVLCHPRYNSTSLEYNVALLFLEHEAVLGGTVDTICLPEKGTALDGAECLSSGWGKDAFGQDGKYQEILKSVRLPLVNPVSCEAALRTTRLGPSFSLGRTFTCAGGKRGVDLCTGDGGSPLVCPKHKDPKQYVQVGISAWGIGCGQAGIPGVYTSVVQAMPWIRAQTRALVAAYR